MDLLVPGVGEHGLDGQSKSLLLSFCQPLKGLGHLLRQVGERKLDGLDRRRFLLHPGEEDEILGQPGQPPDLTADILKPLVAIQLRLHQIQVRADDRQRRFQLMPSVGDEPALLFIALRHRAEDPLGQDQ